MDKKAFAQEYGNVTSKDKVPVFYRNKFEPKNVDYSGMFYATARSDGLWTAPVLVPWSLWVVDKECPELLYHYRGTEYWCIPANCM